MRTVILILLGCATLLLGTASCSNEFSADGETIYDGPVVTNYMSVNIVSGTESNAAGNSRAGTGSATGDGTYVIGNENTVNSVRFYFFKANGEAAYVKNTVNGFQNYLDWQRPDTSAPPSSSGDDVANVEKIVNAQLIINTKEGDGVPLLVVAIVNPPANMPGVSSINALNDITGDYAAVGENSSFVMSNAVYVDGKGSLAEAVSVWGHLHTTPDEALLNPVTIYVERVNAKASVMCRLQPVEEGKNRFDTGVKVNDISDDGLTPGKIYVDFLGWDVTQATNKSYLMKHINEKWTDADVFGSESSLRWNISGRYRSFWAINPSLNAPKADDSNYVFRTFNQHKDAATNFAGGEYLYLQENAAQDATSGCAYPSQLIIAAQLVDASGNPLTLCEYGFFQYTKEGLKKAMADKANIYKKTPLADSEGFRFDKIDDSDLELVSATEAGQASLTEDGRYYVYAAIKGTGPDGKAFDSEEVTDYYIGKEEDAQPATYKEVNDRLLADCGCAKLWDEGYTYYYVDIRHLGEAQSNGWKGIVRNHIYELNITGLTGLGTPVYRPDEVIYPEKPNTDETYIGAEVEILTWRLVNQDVSFAW